MSVSNEPAGLGLASSSTLVMLGVGSSGALMILSRVLLGRLLGTEGLGEISSLWTLFAVLGVIPIAGVGPLVTRHTALYENSSDPALLRGLVLTTLAWLGVLSALLMTVVYFLSEVLASYWLDTPALDRLIRLSLIAIPGWSAVLWAGALFRGYSLTLPTILVRDVVRPFGILVCIIVLWNLGLLTTTSAVLANAVVLGFAGTFGAVWSIRIFLSRTRWGLVNYARKRWLRFSSPLVLSMLLQNITGPSLDVLLLTALSPPAAVGLYVSALSLSQLSQLVAQSANYAALPLFTGSDKTQRAERLASARRLTLHAGTPALIALFFWPDTLIQLTFGATFEGASILLRILAIGTAVRLFVGPQGQMLIAEGRSRWHLLADISSIALFLVVGIGTVPILGPVGIAIARTLARITFEAIALSRVVRTGSGTLFPRGLLVPCVIALAIAFPWRYVTDVVLLGLPNLPELPLRVAALISALVISTVFLLRNHCLTPASALRALAHMLRKPQ